MDICTAGSLDKAFILDLYQNAFPEEERKPFSLIERKAVMGEMEILLITEEKKRIGFAIMAYGDRIVLMDYFAISQKWRGQGYGSAALERIQGLYSDRQLFLEVEKPVGVNGMRNDRMPETQTVSGRADQPGGSEGLVSEGRQAASGEPGFSDQEEIRERRRAFYLRNGMLETGIAVELSGVKMELLSTMPGLTFEQCEPLYRSLFGPIYHNVIKKL
ncbi:MAG: GNAT family N-acetyltransferase [Lachnospiraceae bacterium]|nr:GNAT family N-acetyltransferase [Lachnospiraceae bacterium]